MLAAIRNFHVREEYSEVGLIDADLLADRR